MLIRTILSSRIKNTREISIRCVFFPSNGLSGESDTEVAEEMKLGKKKEKKYLEELVIVEGAEVKYGSAVLDMVERYGAKDSLRARLRMMRRGWRKLGGQGVNRRVLIIVR